MERKFSLIEHVDYGIGYCTLHSSCGTYLAIEQDTQYPSEGISLYKCYLGRAFQFLEVLTALW